MHLAIWSEMGVEVDRSGLPIDMPLLVRLRPSSGYPVEPFAEVCQSPQEVAERSDILSVHVGLSDRTRKLVNADVLNWLKPGAFFVNTARGEIVDYEALAVAIKERNLRVALDVYSRSRPAHRESSAIRCCGCRTSTARTTSAHPPTRHRKRSRPKPSASSARTHRKRGAWPTW